MADTPLPLLPLLCLFCVFSQDDQLQANTKSLMNAVSSLPELAERKRVIDKHTNMATALLKEIKERQIDNFVAVEEELFSGE